MTGCSAYFKCENFQRVGAFKFRGALNAVSQLSDSDKKIGVITHSSGNHAQALSLAASIQGIKATIVMPHNSPKVKVEATKGYGADVVFCEPTVESRVAVATELSEKHGYKLVHPYNDPNIIAGAGTAALELIQEVGCLDYLFAPVGGGGLLSGSAIAAKGLCNDVKVVAAEPKNADDAYRSFISGEIQPSVNPNTIADGLRTQLGDLTFKIIREFVDEIITVSEEEIVASMKLLWERMKLVVEPSGAVSLAGVMKKNDMPKGSRIGIILSGGNINLTGFFKSLLD
ncbi:MAG: pyridoxal-phosphate dependent enzyme [Candidatus Thorarchaeota archaeon]|jgi:threonine dehydratase